MNYRKNSKVLETYLNENGVIRFNLNSPENLNALSENMMDLMQNALDKASHNKNVRVIIISGEGSTFSSGHDLKELKAARKGADKGKKYSYSGLTLEPDNWDKDLFHIKQLIQNITHQEFNSVLLNEYPNGGVGMGWHSDDEKELGINPIIASVSLGAERDFLFRHKKDKSKEPVKILLKHGSLLLMMGNTQHHWHHSLPIRRKVKDKRINLTFRNIV